MPNVSRELRLAPPIFHRYGEFSYAVRWGYALDVMVKLLGYTDLDHAPEEIRERCTRQLHRFKAHGIRSLKLSTQRRLRECIEQHASLLSAPTPAAFQQWLSGAGITSAPDQPGPLPDHAPRANAGFPEPSRLTTTAQPRLPRQSVLTLKSR